jgi:hypothetical protein
MKNIFPVLVVLVLAAGAAAQSLGDVARQSRSEKKQPAVVRVEGEAIPALSSEPSTADQGEAKPDAAPAGDAKTADAKDVKKSPRESAKKNAENWNKKLDAEKQEISTLQRELDIVQREQRLRAAAYYADAGTQIRDQGRFAEESRREQQEIDAKKQALDTARQKLSDLEEQARKEGVRSNSPD